MEAITWVSALLSHTFFTFGGIIKTGMLPEITLLGVVVDKLRPIHTSLADHEYIRAIKAYTERLPVLLTGDLIKENNRFILKNSRQFRFAQAED